MLERNFSLLYKLEANLLIWYFITVQFHGGENKK